MECLTKFSTVSECVCVCVGARSLAESRQFRIYLAHGLIISLLYKVWGVISHPCPNFNCGLVEHLVELEHERMILFHIIEIMLQSWYSKMWWWRLHGCQRFLWLYIRGWYLHMLIITRIKGVIMYCIAEIFPHIVEWIIKETISIPQDWGYLFFVGTVKEYA